MGLVFSYSLQFANPSILEVTLPVKSTSFRPKLKDCYLYSKSLPAVTSVATPCFCFLLPECSPVACDLWTVMLAFCSYSRLCLVDCSDSNVILFRKCNLFKVRCCWSRRSVYRIRFQLGQRRPEISDSSCHKHSVHCWFVMVLYFLESTEIPFSLVCLAVATEKGASL